jgi:cell division septum initiation protein DivIVA
MMRVGATVLLWSVAILILTMLILFYGSFVAADELARMEEENKQLTFEIEEMDREISSFSTTPSPFPNTITVPAKRMATQFLKPGAGTHWTLYQYDAESKEWLVQDATASVDAMHEFLKGEEK